jgi:hypothetical protein
VKQGNFRVTDEGIWWTCRSCETENPLEQEACSACGTPFRETLVDSGVERPTRDPGTTTLFSLFFPGAGHAYLGMWGQAVARGVISLWVIFTALMGAVQARGGTLIAIVFGLASLGMWAVTAHDAYREASGTPNLVILRGKLFLYLVMGLLLILLVLLVTAGFAVSGRG